MLKRITAVSTAPVLIIFFMLFLAHLQPLDAGGLFSDEAAATICAGNPEVFGQTIMKGNRTYDRGV